jgi:NTE family protein
VHRVVRRPEPVPEQTAFVLAGGGSRGAVQVGMLAELVDRGIRADRIYGASVGAVNGAAYAGNPTPEGVERLERIWRDVTGDIIFPRSIMDGPWVFFQRRPSVHANTGLRRIVEEGLTFERLEDAAIPIEVVTTSLTDGREHWLTHGPAVEAVLASSAIPAMFPPVVIDGDTLIDGGVVNNVPISRALAGGATRIYVLLCGPLYYRPNEPRRPVEGVLTALFVAIHARFSRELAMLPPGVEVVVFSGGGDPSVAYRDFSGTPQLIEDGRAEVAAVLDRYEGNAPDLRPGNRPAVPVSPAPPGGRDGSAGADAAKGRGRRGSPRRIGGRLALPGGTVVQGGDATGTHRGAVPVGGAPLPPGAVGAEEDDVGEVVRERGEGTPAGRGADPGPAHDPVAAGEEAPQGPAS